MRTLSFALLMVLMGGAVVFAAHALGGAIAASFNQSATMIAEASHD